MTMNELTLRREEAKGYLVMTLNRPARKNALSGALIEAIGQGLREADADDTIRAVVLTGEGKAFCAGGDLAEGLGGGGGVIGGHSRRAQFGEVLGAFRAVRMPVIAAVNGDALGGGLGLATACDLVIADPAARFGTPEIRLGLFPWVILAVLQRHVPRKRLMEMVLLGEKMPAEKALELGLVNRVSVPGGSLKEAEELACTLAGRAPVSVEMGKAAFYAIENLSFDEALRFLNSQLTLNLLTEDAMEGVAAFLQKRDPEWKGR